MATVHNPTPFDLFCLELRRSIRPGGTEQVTETQADRIPTGVFVVTPSEASPAPVRKVAKRGGKVAEVTGAPAKETR